MYVSNENRRIRLPPDWNKPLLCLYGKSGIAQNPPNAQLNSI